MTLAYFRLQLQLTDASSSTKSSKQLQIPGGAAGGNGNKLRQQQSSSIQPVGLEEPRSNHHMSTFKGGSPANVAPVGAQPPVIGGNPEVVPQHQVRKEDVMEAPKVIQHFENLDAQHDQPGLQAPVYHDSHGFTMTILRMTVRLCPKKIMKTIRYGQKFSFERLEKRSFGYYAFCFVE